MAGPPRPSPHRWRVHDAALGPQRVQAARDLERRALPDVALEHLAVITDVLEDTVGPVLGEAELLAEIALGTEQALDVGIVGLEVLVDVRLADADLPGIHHAQMHPF